MTELLLLEDDLKISEFVKKGFEESGLKVDQAFTGPEGLALSARKKYAAMIVDVMVPEIDGIAFVEKIRSQGITTPVLILSAKRSIEDRVGGLQVGGDDYMVKPFAFSELLARIQVLLLRRDSPKPVTRLSANGISVDLMSREVLRNGVKIEIQVKEFQLLELFLRNQNQILTKTQILEKVWGYSFDPQTNVVDVLVCRLRNKIDKDFSQKTIQTIRGAGYVFRST